MANRIQKLQKTLLDLDALIVDEPVDLYYLTGLLLSLGRLLILREEAVLFVDGRYFEACRQKSPCKVVLTMKGYGLESPLPDYFKGLGKIGFDANTTPYSRYEELQKTATGALVAVNDPVKKIRAVKEPEEIERLRESAELASRGLDFILGEFEEGVSEQEIARALEIFWLRSGGDKLSFDPIIAFGEGSSQPHYRAGERRLKRGDLIQIDMGVMRRGYHSDMSRVFFFGEPPEEAERVFQVVKKAQAEAISLCRLGALVKELDRAARSVIEEAGYGEYFPHSLGHGVGLDLHEFPLLKSADPFGNVVLAPGMLITIEPGIYLPGKFGIRLEDAILITEGGYENLTGRPLTNRLPQL